MVKKHFFLFAALVVETLVLSFCAYLGYQAFISFRNKGQVKGVSVINAEYIVRPSSELKYYYSHLPSMTETQKVDWMKTPAIYTFNNDGFNESQDYNVQRDTQKVFRIVTLGDSFTFGQFVSTQDNWTEQLEDLLNTTPALCGKERVEVINLGMPGFDVQYSVKRYEELGAKYSPDLIVWFESRSGFYRINELFQPLINEYDQKYASLSGKEKELQFIDSWVLAQAQVNREHSQQWLSDTIFSSFQKFNEDIGETKLLMATFDDANQREIEEFKRWSMNRRNTLQFLGVSHLNKNEMLKDGHPNKVGHKKIANSFFTYLKDTQNQAVLCK